jgi:hypothetical protein
VGSNISNTVDQAPVDLLTSFGESITGAIEKFIDKVTPKEKRYVPFLQFADTVVIPAGGFAVVRLGSPTKGRFWYVRMLRAGGIVTTTAAVGRADVFVGPDDYRGVGAINQMLITQWRDSIAAMPNTNQYSNGSFRVGPQEAVYVAFTGATVAQQYMASLEAYEYPDTDKNIEWVS